MKPQKPEYHLQRVFADETNSPLQIFPVLNLPDPTGKTRWAFLGAGITAASLLSLVTGCGQQSPSTQVDIAIVPVETISPKINTPLPTNKTEASEPRIIQQVAGNH